MFLAAVPSNDTDSVKIQLPKEGLEVDPRVTGFTVMMERDNYGHVWNFDCSIDGSTLTVTLSKSEHQHAGSENNGIGWHFTLYFRIYDPAIESVPDFDSRSYKYCGLENEHAPLDATHITFHESVKIVREYAFCCCRDLTQCFMTDAVTQIEEGAFDSCESLENIRLSQSLVSIGRGAFYNCRAMDRFFFPQTLGEIDEGAFMNCTSVRILTLPDDMDLGRIGSNITKGCTSLHLLKEEEGEEYEKHYNNCGHMNHCRNHFRHCPLLHASTQPDVTSSMIKSIVKKHSVTVAMDIPDSHGLTALHILCMNPHVNLNTIVTCYHVLPTMLVLKDAKGMTPLDYLRKREEKDAMECIVHFMQDLCIHRLL